jgi:hypothetical protein
MRIDFLNDIMMPSPTLMAGKYLSGSTPSYVYAFPAAADGSIDVVFSKGINTTNNTTYPWDWCRASGPWIRQLLTEKVWTDPSTGKMFFQNGARRFPRYLDYTPSTLVVPPPVYTAGSASSDIPGVAVAYMAAPDPVMPTVTLLPEPGSWSFTLAPPETDYLTYETGGVPDAVRYSNKLCRCTVRGPYLNSAAIGDLPAGEDWFADYERGGALVNGVVQYTAKETKQFRRGYGPIAWFEYDAVNGVYPATPTSQSATNKINTLTGPYPIPVQKIF